MMTRLSQCCCWTMTITTNSNKKKRRRKHVNYRPCSMVLLLLLFTLVTIFTGYISSPLISQQEQQCRYPLGMIAVTAAFTTRSHTASISSKKQPIPAAVSATKLSSSSFRTKRKQGENDGDRYFNNNNIRPSKEYFSGTAATSTRNTRHLASLSAVANSAIGGDDNDKKSTTLFQNTKQSISKFIQTHFLVCGMAVAVSFAKVYPSLGASKTIAEYIVSKVGVFLVFLISGWSLELSELKDALLKVKLNVLIQSLNFVAWPYLIGLPVTFILKTFVPSSIIPSSLLDGILILTCLPTTVNMCIFLTQTSGGNVACALCNAVIGNTLGIFITPALLLKFFGTHIQLPFRDMVLKLMNKVLVPVMIGQTLRQNSNLKTFYQQHTKAFKKVNELALISIVWTSFCHAFSEGVVGLDPRNVAILLVLLPLMHIGSVVGLFTIFDKLYFSPKDVVAATFTASHKTLAFGLPLIKTVFDGNPNLASYCAPVMLIHPLQLVLGSFTVPTFTKYIQNNQQKNETD